MSGRFKHEDIAAVPRGFSVRTVKRGGHQVRIAFPPGRRRKGAGRLVSILHPVGENPCRLNPAELVVMGANPSTEGAEKLFQEFHGSTSTGYTTYDEPHVGGTLTELGDMVELTLLRPRGNKWGEIDFAGCGVKLASNAKGTQLYLVGGDQKLGRGTLTYLGADNSKDLIDLGEALKIVYRAKKAQTDQRAANWEHDFGEETGKRPQVSYDKLQKRILFSGGEYTIEAPGIIN